MKFKCNIRNILSLRLCMQYYKILDKYSIALSGLEKLFFV